MLETYYPYFEDSLKEFLVKHLLGPSVALSYLPKAPWPYAFHPHLAINFQLYIHRLQAVIGDIPLIRYYQEVARLMTQYRITGMQDPTQKQNIIVDGFSLNLEKTFRAFIEGLPRVSTLLKMHLEEPNLGNSEENDSQSTEEVTSQNTEENANSNNDSGELPMEEFEGNLKQH